MSKHFSCYDNKVFIYLIITVLHNKTIQFRLVLGLIKSTILMIWIYGPYLNWEHK